MERVVHPFAPIFDQNSKILILGSFPSVKSREGCFYYHHHRNRFWKVISLLFQEPEPIEIEEKKNLLLKHQIAVWDVIASCEIKGSSDSSIQNVIPNPIEEIIKKTKIQKIGINGQKAFQLYMKYCYPNTCYPAYRLPSTSPANASYSLEKLRKEWEKCLCLE